MQHINWRRTLSGIAVATVLLGCSQPNATAPKEESTGIHIPSSLAQLTQSTVTIENLSSDQVSQTIQVEGTVLKQAPLLEGVLYQIEDATGQLWILSSESLPDVGASLRVRGVLQYEPIVISGADIGEYYLQEQSRSVLNPTETDAAN
ncbi:hypothetical protein PN498_16520 [Oscillatoria sp. CS-180]|nr:hypothetical protein [Oscillatoria sp. CS-180]